MSVVLGFLLSGLESASHWPSRSGSSSPAIGRSELAHEGYLCSLKPVVPSGHCVDRARRPVRCRCAAEPDIPDDDGAVLSPLLDVLFGFIAFKVSTIPPEEQHTDAPAGKEV